MGGEELVSIKQLDLLRALIKTSGPIQKDQEEAGHQGRMSPKSIPLTICATVICIDACGQFVCPFIPVFSLILSASALKSYHFSMPCSKTWADFQTICLAAS